MIATELSPKLDPGSSELPELPELLALPLAERARLIERQEISARDWRDQADRWAFRADERYRACVDLRELPEHPAAIRLGVKDTIDVSGFPTRLGLRHYRHHPAESAAPLRGIGLATVNAKVVTTELNIGVGSGCVNPYFPHVDPAGSSTGSAVSVAANICDVSLGTDVLGSVRWPAGRCGVVGLRTTHQPDALAGVFPLSPSMDAAGWLARTAEDLAFAWTRLGLGRAEAARPLRIGLIQNVLEGAVDDEVVGALDTTAAALRRAGHTVSPVRLGELWDCRGAAWEMCSRDAWDGFQHWRHRIDERELDPSTCAALEAGSRVSDERYAAIVQARRANRTAVTALFAEQLVDAWLLPLDPTVPRVCGSAPPATSTIPQPGDDLEVGYTPVASFAGLPAITFPAGISAATGVPLAVQLVGPPDTDGALIRLAQDASAHENRSA
jgi:Asp-tRNA(Asn)/Glu-tRNA(Gln) amidotransferase A subunit family amidase